MHRQNILRIGIPKIRKALKKYFFSCLIISIVPFSICCNNSESFGSSSSNAITKPLDSIRVTKNDSPIQNYVANEQPVERWKSKVPRSDTSLFYGVEIDDGSDTVIYTQNGEILEEGVLIANFIEVQVADFVHISIKDSSGWYHSFFVMLPDQKKMLKY